MKRIIIKSDGTSMGTRVVDQNNHDISRFVVDIELKISASDNSNKAKITFEAPEYFGEVDAEFHPLADTIPETMLEYLRLCTCEQINQFIILLASDKDMRESGYRLQKGLSEFDWNGTELKDKQVKDNIW